jgi:hypothetical protein
VDALVGLDFQRDKITARATDDDPAVGYFHARTMDQGDYRGDKTTRRPAHARG